MFYKIFLTVFVVIFGCSVFAEQPVYVEQIYFSTPEALKKSFPKAESFSEHVIEINQEQKDDIEKMLRWKLSDKQFKIYKAKSADNITLGYGLVLDEKGKYNPITFLTAITTDFIVKDVVVMIYREKIGSEVRKKRFLKQFYKKSAHDSLVVDRDIMGISGATISSWSLATGVKKALTIVETLYLNS